MKVQLKALFVATSLFVVGAVAPTLAQDIATGMKYLDAEQFNKANDVFSALATSAPSADNQFYLGYYKLRLAQNALRLDKPDQAKAAGLDAKAAFEKANATDPKFTLGFVGLAGVALLNKDLAGAKAQVGKALEMSKSKDEKVLYRAAEMYTIFDDESTANDPAEAIRLIDMIPLLKKKTEDPEYYIVKGDAFRLKGGSEGGPAVTEYERANGVKAQAKVYTKIGKVFKGGKNYKFAQENFKSSILADSMYAPNYREFGELWLLARNYKNAAFNYKKYIDVLEKGDPRDVTQEVLLRYSKVAFLSKDYTNAESALARVKNIKDSDILRMGGYIAYQKENYTKAAENLEQLLKELPDNKKLMSDYGFLGRSYGKLKKDDEALSYLGKAAADTIENYYQDIYNVIYAKKDYKKAAEVYKDAMKWKVDRKEKLGTNDYLSLGRAYYFAGQGTKAAKDTLGTIALGQKADSIFALIPAVNATYTMVNVWRARANAYIDLDQTKALAIPHYQKFIEVGDKDKNKNEMFESLTALGRYNLVIVKDSPKALEYLNKAFELKPEDAYLKALMDDAKGITAAPVPTPGAAVPVPPVVPAKGTVPAVPAKKQ